MELYQIKHLFLNISKTSIKSLYSSDSHEFKFLMFAYAAHYVVEISPELLAQFSIYNQSFCMGLTHTCIDPNYCILLDRIDLNENLKDQYMSTRIYNLNTTYFDMLSNTKGVSELKITSEMNNTICNHIQTDIIPGLEEQSFNFKNSKLIQLNNLELFKKKIES